MFQFPDQVVTMLSLWLGYFALHSLMASLLVKRAVARFWPGSTKVYRLLFNAQSVLLLLVPLWYMKTHTGDLLWQWQDGFEWLSYALIVVALYLLVISSRGYDMQEFIGLRQWRNKVGRVEDQEVFYISPAHRFVRHPWYSCFLLIIWLRPMDELGLISNIAMTTYFIIGARLEERKLYVYHGDYYRQYQQQVPSLLPRPWRYMSKQAAQQLIQHYQQSLK